MTRKKVFIRRTETTLRIALLALSLLQLLDVTGTTALVLEGTSAACKVLAGAITIARKRGWLD